MNPVPAKHQQALRELKLYALLNFPDLYPYIFKNNNKQERDDKSKQ